MEGIMLAMVSAVARLRQIRQFLVKHVQLTRVPKAEETAMAIVFQLEEL